MKRERLAKLPVNEILVGVSLLVSACISIFLTRAPGGIALFWPSSAITAAIIIRLPRVRWVSAAIAIVLALITANIVAGHRPWPISALFSSINVLEIVMMVLACRILWRFPYPQITISQGAIMTGLMGIAVPGIAAALGGLLLYVKFATPWLTGTLQWWSSHMIGACLVAPPIILFSVKALKRLIRTRYRIENALILLACLFGCYLTIRFVRFPFVSIGVLLLVAAFRLGGGVAPP